MNAPRTADGRAAWAVLSGCRFQVRMGMNGPYGLDFGAVMQMAAARGAASALLAEVLPDVEMILVGLLRRSDDGLDDGPGGE